MSPLMTALDNHLSTPQPMYLRPWVIILVVVLATFSAVLHG